MEFRVYRSGFGDLSLGFRVSSFRVARLKATYVFGLGCG